MPSDAPPKPLRTPEEVAQEINARCVVLDSRVMHSIETLRLLAKMIASDRAAVRAGCCDECRKRLEADIATI